MSHSMDGYDDPHGIGRWDKGVTDSVEDVLRYGRREPTARELDAMNAQRSESAHERDAELYSSKFGTKIVQVRIAGANARTYAYEVPRTEDVSLGDWVEIPGNVVNEFGSFGVVKGFGRQGYNGPLKMIVRKIDEPDELMIRMSVVKTKDQAAKIYDAALDAGWGDGELSALKVLGEQRLKSRGVR